LAPGADKGTFKIFEPNEVLQPTGAAITAFRVMKSLKEPPAAELGVMRER
jgi:hypothetical protein